MTPAELNAAADTHDTQPLAALTGNPSAIGDMTLYFTTQAHMDGGKLTDYTATLIGAVAYDISGIAYSVLGRHDVVWWFGKLVAQWERSEARNAFDKHDGPKLYEDDL